MKNTILLLLFATTVYTANAQLSGSAGIVTNTNISLPAGQHCDTLRATVTGGNQTTAYTVSQIAYNPPVSFDSGTSVLVHTDDLWTTIINMPFNFCYFANTYNRLVIGSNGEISFNAGNAGGPNNWSIPRSIPFDSIETDQRNTIMAPWQDLDPTNFGTLRYYIGGTAPNRYFAVSFTNCSMYGDSGSVETGYCSHNDHQTSMAVLYETSNNIDIYIATKDTICSDLSGGVEWNNAWAIEGIMDSTGTIAYAVPGRNATKWVAYNDAWRFAPAGPSNYTLAWYQGTTLLGTGDSVIVCPSSTTNYQALAVINLCSGGFLTLTDTVTVHTTGLTIDTAIITNPGCGASGSIIAVVSGATGPITYNWSNGQTTAHDTGLIAGTYTLTVTDTAGATVTATYVLQQTSSLAITASSTAVNCFGDTTGSATVTAVGGTGSYTYLWNNGQTTATDTGLIAAAYTVTVSSGTCSATGTFTVTSPPILYYFDSITKPVSCYGDSNGYVLGRPIGGTPPYTYAWSDGAHGATDTGLAPGSYFLTVTDNVGCNVASLFVISQPSAVSITGAQVQSACPGSGSIILAATGGTGALSYRWSPNVSASDTALSIPAGNYNITVTDSNSCSLTATYTVNGPPVLNQQLCLVTDDTTSTVNILIWEKLDKQATDSFFIYRTNTPDTTYTEIAAIPRDSLSEYVDNGANPSQTSYRYKINLKDTCGNYSALSNYIQTIYLQYLGSGNFQWTPYDVENESGPVLSYNLLRDNTSNGNWVLVAQTLTDTTLTDTDFALYPFANYEVEAVLNVQCTPSRAVSSVTSNIIRHRPLAVSALTTGNISLLPNPAHNQFEIISSNTQNNIQSISIFDQLGNKLTVPYTQSGAGKLTADITTLAAGMYYVQINCVNTHSVLKVIKQ